MSTVAQGRSPVQALFDAKGILDTATEKAHAAQEIFARSQRDCSTADYVQLKAEVDRCNAIMAMRQKEYDAVEREYFLKASCAEQESQKERRIARRAELIAQLTEKDDRCRQAESMRNQLLQEIQTLHQERGLVMQELAQIPEEAN